MPLDETQSAPDTDLLGDPVVTEAAPARGKSTIDGLVLTMTDKDGPRTYDAGALMPGTMTNLAMIGLRYLLANTGDPAARFAEIKAGGVVGRKPAGPAELDPWRLAVAHAAVEETKKTDAPLSLDQAKDNAAKITRDGLTAAKKIPVVVKHYARITNAPAPSAAALFG